jgi:hypothetical protein
MTEPSCSETYRYKNGVLGDALILQPLAKTAYGNAGSFSDAGIRVAQPNLDYGPDLTHKRGHKFAATLNSDTQGKHGGTPVRCVWRREILCDENTKSREDLCWRKRCREAINDAKCELR